MQVEVEEVGFARVHEGINRIDQKNRRVIVRGWHMQCMHGMARLRFRDGVLVGADGKLMV